MCKLCIKKIKIKISLLLDLRTFLIINSLIAFFYLKETFKMWDSPCKDFDEHFLIGGEASRYFVDECESVKTCKCHHYL